jgi:ankyrin repeat protein
MIIKSLQEIIDYQRTAISVMLDRLREMVPKKYSGESCINVHHTINLSTLQPRLEFFELAVYMVSNFFILSAGLNIRDLLIQLLQCHHNREVLGKMLSQNLATVQTFAEKMIRAAAQANDMKLVAYFLNSGALVAPADMLWKLVRDIRWLFYCNDDIQHLLKLILAVWDRVWQIDKAHGSKDRLSLALDRACNDKCKQERMHWFLFAVASLDRLDVLDNVLNSYPHLMAHDIHGEPLSLIETVAEHGCQRLIQYLVERFGDSNYRDGPVYGRALAAAAANARLEVLDYLLSLTTGFNLCRFYRNRFDHRGRRFASTALEEAAFANRTEAVRLLLERGATPDSELQMESSSIRRPTALQGAALHGNLNSVRYLIRAGADINIRSTVSRMKYKEEEEIFAGTALEAAVESGRVDVVTEILRAGAATQGPSANAYPQQSALQRACIQGRLDIVCLLIEHGADVNDQVALKIAMRGNHLDIVELLVEQGADFTSCAAKLMRSAVESGVTNNVRWLLDHGVKQTDGKALAAATRSGNVDIVKLLLEVLSQGIIRIPPCDMAEAMQDAILRGQLEVTKLLLDHGAPIFGIPVYPPGGSRPEEADALALLGGVQIPGRAVELAKMLMAAGTFDLDKYTNIGSLGATPLQRAIYSNNYELAAFLLRKGADANAPAFGSCGNSSKRYQGRTALQAAAENNASGMVDFLLRANADVNAAPSKYRGATAVQFAAARGNFAIVQTLIDAGADIDAPAAAIAGFTALEGAAMNGRLDMVGFLLNSGADVAGYYNGQFRRAVGIAWLRGHYALSKYLQDYKRQKLGSADCQPLDEILEFPDVIRWDDSSFDLSTGEDFEFSD